MPPCVSSASLHTRRGQTSPHTLAALAEETLRTLNQSICAELVTVCNRELLVQVTSVFMLEESPHADAAQLLCPPFYRGPLNGLRPVSVIYGAYAGGFDAGTTATIARRLGATELRARTRGRNSAAEEKRVEAATDAWGWVEAHGADYYDKVQSVVLNQINRSFPKLEQAVWKNCLHNLHDALCPGAMALGAMALKRTARSFYTGGPDNCKRQCARPS
jgi:hypothetical protein